MNLFNRNKPSRIRKACQVSSQSDEPEESIAATESGPGELIARKVQHKEVEQPIWRKRGLFAVGGVFGAPRVGQVRKNTK